MQQQLSKILTEKTKPHLSGVRNGVSIVWHGKPFRIWFKRFIKMESAKEIQQIFRENQPVSVGRLDSDCRLRE